MVFKQWRLSRVGQRFGGGGQTGSSRQKGPHSRGRECEALCSWGEASAGAERTAGERSKAEITEVLLLNKLAVKSRGRVLSKGVTVADS